MSSNAESFSGDSPNSLTQRFEAVRALTVSLTDTLMAEDTVVQSMPDVSPTKWHLAHVTWFFERFVLRAHARSYRCFNDNFDFLFNSYYYTAGKMHSRSQRGLLSRPTLVEIVDCRKHVDEAVCHLLDSRGDEKEIHTVITLGLNHEQQHQELLLTDIKHVLSCNPMRPAANPSLPPLTRDGPMPGCQPNSNGNMPQVGMRSMATCSTALTGIQQQVQRHNNFTATFGNGHRLRMRPTRVSSLSRDRSASTTANLCATR
jgi:hypothetical protein